jgi:hypothetical protein
LQSWNPDTFFLQHGDQGNQRQADQRRGIITFNPFDQRDAQRFDLGAAGTVVGLILLQITFDLSRIQFTETHGGRYIRQLHGLGFAIEQA